MHRGVGLSYVSRGDSFCYYEGVVGGGAASG